MRSMVKAERLKDVRGFIGGLYGPDLHGKRVGALAGATLGVMTGASLAIAMIGRALVQGLATKHAASLDALASGKQVDRVLSNQGIDIDAALRIGCPLLSGRAAASTWPWTGPSSTLTVRPPSCCHC